MEGKEGEGEIKPSVRKLWLRHYVPSFPSVVPFLATGLSPPYTGYSDY
jgi:hypothetical protein